MEVVSAPKLVIGVLFALVGILVLVASRGSRGFDQRRQAGVLLLIGSAVFVARGLGRADP